MLKLSNFQKIVNSLFLMHICRFSPVKIFLLFFIINFSLWHFPCFFVPPFGFHDWLKIGLWRETTVVNCFRQSNCFVFLVAALLSGGLWLSLFFRVNWLADRCWWWCWWSYCRCWWWCWWSYCRCCWWSSLPAMIWLPSSGWQY